VDEAVTSVLTLSVTAFFCACFYKTKNDGFAKFAPLIYNSIGISELSFYFTSVAGKRLIKYVKKNNFRRKIE